MLARIRKSMEDKDQGFTLIELLVVMIIIGILAAIAIPVFLNQRQKAADTATKSDMRTVANEEEAYFTDAQNYVAVANGSGTVRVGTAAVAGGAAATGNEVKLSDGVNVSVKLLSAAGTAITTGTATGFCITGYNTKGSKSTSGNAYYYNSLDRGFTTTPCP
ncbi:type II secretion system protein [Kineococcus glutinatus]|uniref:Prepilin-type N-terminal cleavage/methylation domain-containing protein n=1 Tax=Kineococcus glutinatus TaxID=1070872 RepID=A0ABP9HCT1_9ACTN